MPPLIFLHGWTMKGAVFDNLIARLGPGVVCAAPDLPGHASAAAQPATLSACVQALNQMLDRLAPRRPVLVGWSMGAAVAWRYCQLFGDTRLAGLVTVDMSPQIVPRAGWRHGLIGQSAQSIAATTRRFARDWPGAVEGIATTMFANRQGAPGFSRETARRVILSQDPDKMRALWADLVAMDARAAIADIQVPYLVCSGAQSRVYPASAADWIAGQAPQARRLVFDHSGHSPHLEEPDGFARAVTRFARGLAG